MTVQCPCHRVRNLQPNPDDYPTPGGMDVTLLRCMISILQSVSQVVTTYCKAMMQVLILILLGSYLVDKWLLEICFDIVGDRVTAAQELAIELFCGLGKTQASCTTPHTSSTGRRHAHCCRCILACPCTLGLVEYCTAFFG